VVGRTTLVDTVPMGYGRSRGDAGAYPVDDIMIARSAAPWPDSVGAVLLSAPDVDGRMVIILNS